MNYLFREQEGAFLAGAIAAPAPSAQASESDDLRAALKATDSPLRTPFEKSNGARWTSFEQWLEAHPEHRSHPGHPQTTTPDPSHP